MLGDVKIVSGNKENNIEDRLMAYFGTRGRRRRIHAYVAVSGNFFFPRQISVEWILKALN